MSETRLEYPTWICLACGLKWGRRLDSLEATWHEAVCDLCGELCPVTEPRDFGHLCEGWEKRVRR